MNLGKGIILFMRKMLPLKTHQCNGYESKSSYYYVCLLMVIRYSFASVSNGPYIGLEAGVANEILNYNAASFNLSTNSIDLTNSATAFLMRGNLGYNLNKYNGFELGYTYTFNISYPNPNGAGNFNVNATTLDAGYILSLPTVVEKLSVFGRIGFAYDWLNSGSSCGCLINNAINSGGFADILGAGIKYRLSPKLVWRIQWIANGLIFPLRINSGTQEVNWTSQTFQTGFNYSF